jgi:hypothetical protein
MKKLECEIKLSLNGLAGCAPLRQKQEKLNIDKNPASD